MSKLLQNDSVRVSVTRFLTRIYLSGMYHTDKGLHTTSRLDSVLATSDMIAKCVACTIDA